MSDDDRLKLYLGTIDYLEFSVTADVTLNAQTVEVSFDRKGDWLAAEWIGDPGTTRRGRVAINEDNLPIGKHAVYVRVHHSDLVKPLLYAGGVHVA